MADKKLMVDSSILIDYFRKTDKKKTRLVQHFRKYSEIFISSITEFEILNGSTENHKKFWGEKLYPYIIVLDFDSRTAREAAKIVSDLKPKRKSIDKPDLFIATTALVYELPFDTLNTQHFIHIDRLKLVPKE